MQSLLPTIAIGGQSPCPHLNLDTFSILFSSPSLWGRGRERAVMIVFSCPSGWNHQSLLWRKGWRTVDVSEKSGRRIPVRIKTKQETHCRTTNNSSEDIHYDRILCSRLSSRLGMAEVRYLGFPSIKWAFLLMEEEGTGREGDLKIC